MATLAQRWPHNAENYRIDTINYAREIVRQLMEALDTEDRTTRSQKIMSAIDRGFEIERMMIEAKYPEVKQDLEEHKPAMYVRQFSERGG